MSAVCKAGIANCKCTLQLHLGDDVFMCFIKVPAGEFMMGSRGYGHSEEPMHRVVISKDFYLATTPVTQRQARVLTAGAGIEHKNYFDGHDLRPAEQLSAKDADACCAWLADNQHDNPDLLADDGTCRYVPGLPSEAQWEYACKYGVDDGLEYYSGDGVAALARAGWFAHGVKSGDGKGNSGDRTQAVAGRQASVLGFYDLQGNVWEWCRDAWVENAYRYRIDGILDPVSTTGTGRVRRGGSWNFHATYCRASYRIWIHPVNRGCYGGFRVGLFPVPCQPEQAEKQQQS